MSNLIDRLIDHETGEIDRAAVFCLARIKAEQEYGAPNYPPVSLRTALQTCLDRAHAMRLAWLRDHNLPFHEQATMMQVPTWGNSGDSF